MLNVMRTLFVLLSGWSVLTAAILDDAFDFDSLHGKKVGYYAGSFDPFHLGHQHVIDRVLEEGFVDYVLVYPVPGSDCFKHRSDVVLRQKMIAGIYRDHPKVLLTDWFPKLLQERFLTAPIEKIGIIGSDIITDKLLSKDRNFAHKYDQMFMRGIPLKEGHYRSSIGAIIALKIDAFIVSLRDGCDLTHLDGRVVDREIVGSIQASGCSSTQVRNLIGMRCEFEHLVSPSVAALIKGEGMYTYDGISQ